MKQKFENLKNNEEFQDKLQKMKPKRNIWGVLIVIVLFFIPEYINVKYGKEINEWIVNMVQNHPIEEMKELTIWLSAKALDGNISIINVSMGIAVLVWIFWDDISRFIKKEKA